MPAAQYLIHHCLTLASGEVVTRVFSSIQARPLTWCNRWVSADKVGNGGGSYVTAKSPSSTHKGRMIPKPDSAVVRFMSRKNKYLNMRREPVFVFVFFLQQGQKAKQFPDQLLQTAALLDLEQQTNVTDGNTHLQGCVFRVSSSQTDFIHNARLTRQRRRHHQRCPGRNSPGAEGNSIL